MLSFKNLRHYAIHEKPKTESSFGDNSFITMNRESKKKLLNNSTNLCQTNINHLTSIYIFNSTNNSIQESLILIQLVVI